MFGPVAALITVCLLPAVFGQQQVFKWNVKDYPDPYSFDSYLKCGRSNLSNICDPNRIISKQKADEIDSLIWSVYRETRCPCPICIANSYGYAIRVAIMHKMESIYKENNISEATLKDAQMFSYMLTNKWSMAGKCNASLLILYSRDDGILFTVTLSTTREKLTDEIIKRISLNVRPLFDDIDTVGFGIQEMIRRYKMVLNKEDEALTFKTARQQSGSANGVTFSLHSVFVTALLFVIFHQ